MATVKKPSYKYCVVPMCKSTTKRTPNKLFFRMPCDAKLRNQWCKMMRRDNVALSSCLYCCEDHFNLPTDMSNYIRYRIMGKVTQIHVRRGCVPTKFDCQKSSTNSLATASDANETQVASTSQKSLDGTKLRGGKKKKNRLGGKKKVAPVPQSMSQDLDMEVVKTEIEYVDPETSLYFDEEDSPEESTEPQGEETLFKGQQCSVCDNEIVGFRYTCVQCSDLDLCGACEARGQHQHHYVLRVPADRPAEEIQSVLATIRVHLMKDLDPIAGIEPDPGKSVKEEIQPEDEEEIGNMSAHEEFNEEAAPDVCAPRTKVLTKKFRKRLVLENCSTTETMTSDEQPAEEPHGSISQRGVKTDSQRTRKRGRPRRKIATKTPELQNKAKGKKRRVVPAGTRNVDVSTVLSAESLSAGNFKMLHLPLRPTTGLNHASSPRTSKRNRSAKNKR